MIVTSNPIPARVIKQRRVVIVNQRFAFREKHERPDEGVTSLKCDLCNLSLNDTGSTATDHAKDELHLLRVKYRKNRREFDSTKQKMAVWMDVNDMNDVEIKVPVRVGARKELPITYMNRLEQGIEIEKVFELMPHGGISVDGFSCGNLKAGEQRNATVKALLFHRGHRLYPLVFKLRKEDGSEPEYFLKDIHFLVQSEIMDLLKPVTPYKPSAGPVVKLEEGPTLLGVPAPYAPSDLKLTLNLKMKFEIPKPLFWFLNHGFKPRDDMSKEEADKLNEITNLLSSNSDPRNLLNTENYDRVLELLLFIEEHQMNKDIHNYDMRDAVLERSPDGLWLEVPGLAEKRPSLLINDSVKVNYVGQHSMNYEGRVHRVHDKKVLLGFHPKFVKEYKGNKLEVRFTLNRSNLKNMHRALFIMKMHRAQSLLFPSADSKPIKQPPLRPWFNSSIGDNPEQQKAVRNIVWQSSQNSPYLIFGPPGTGKTVTMVETILQLWEPEERDSRKTRNRILVCAPSNTAADVLTERLLPQIELRKKPSKHILRMYAMSRPWKDVPPKIQSAEISNHNDSTGEVFFPRKEVIEGYDIVISTFSCAARLVSAEVAPGHFTHILMDEVGQAMEPEALLPIAGLATSADCPGRLMSQVVMAGDPKQLGPVLQSPIASKYGLDKSLLERLMDMNLYQKGTDNKYNPNVLTKLVRNYRSHKCLLDVPNELFYDGELKVEGDPAVIDAACNWKGLVKKGSPLIVHGVEGLDEREGNSPSYFNRQEIEIIFDYISQMLNDKVFKEEEIGIVTPYSKQVEKIRKALKQQFKGKTGINVGSVEQYQGQEKKVIIISTVRSRAELLQHDYKYQLGFLRNPKRFNVAVTRARALLIVVGNPNVLQFDDCWRKLIDYALKNGLYKGYPFSLDNPER